LVLEWIGRLFGVDSSIHAHQFGAWSVYWC
jgi:hypothetical protein